MSLKNVEAFYKRLATDEAFNQLIKAAKSKKECSKIVKQHGYEFTQQEWEDYTANLLGLTDDNGLVDLNEKELEAVWGGALESAFGGYTGDYQFPPMMAMYGVPIMGNYPIQPQENLHSEERDDRDLYRRYK